MHSIPEEVIERVVGFLSHNDKALKSCSLVSKAWTPYTRDYLIPEHILLTPRNAFAFHDLWKSPHVTLAPYIEGITIQCNIDLFLSAVLEDIALVMGAAGVSLTSLMIELGPEIADWPSNALFTYPQTFPSIERLSVQFSHETTSLTLLEFISEFESLETLELKIDAYQLVDCVHRRLPSGLKSLHLYYSNDSVEFVDWLLSRHHHLTLSSLVLHKAEGLTSSDVPTINNFFRVNPQLRHLSLLVGYGGVVDLGRLTRLASLEFIVPKGYPLSIACATTLSAKCHNTLREVYVHCTGSARAYLWSQLHSALWGRFHRLRGLVLSIEGTCSKRDKESISACFPEYMGKGMLTIVNNN